MINQLQQPFIYADFSGGLIDDLSVGKGLMPPNAVAKAINVLFDRPRGSVSQRLGSTALGAVISAGNTLRGLTNFITASINKPLAVVNGSVYTYNGSSWASAASGLTTTLKTRFITYLNEVAYMNGTDTAKSSTNGTSFAATGGNLDIAHWPTSTFATILNARVLTGGDSSNPDTITLSSIVSGGAISWTAGQKTVQVNPNDGSGGLTWATGNGRLALLFKQRSLYRYDDSSLDRIGAVGTPSGESVVTDDGGVTYFFGQGANTVGFYATDGGKPVKISRAITRYVEAIAASYYTSVAARTNGTSIEWDIGSVTIGENTYSNACVVYSISDKTWTVFNRADSFRVFSHYIDSSGNVGSIGGDTSGFVQVMDSGNTDNGVMIYSELEMYPIVFTTRGRVKTVGGLVTLAEHFQGLNLSLKADNGRFMELGSIVEHNQYFHNFDDMKGYEFTPKLSAANSGSPWTLTGIEFPNEDVQDHDYQH